MQEIINAGSAWERAPGLHDFPGAISALGYTKPDGASVLNELNIATMFGFLAAQTSGIEGLPRLSPAGPPPLSTPHDMSLIWDAFAPPALGPATPGCRKSPSPQMPPAPPISPTSGTESKSSTSSTGSESSRETISSVESPPKKPLVPTGQADWESRKNIIRELYMDQNLILNEVMEIMLKKHNFKAT